MINTETILTRILEALDGASPEVARVLTYIFEEVDSNRRNEADVLHLIQTASPLLKRLGA